MMNRRTLFAVLAGTVAASVVPSAVDAAPVERNLTIGVPPMVASNSLVAADVTRDVVTAISKAWETAMTGPPQFIADVVSDPGMADGPSDCTIYCRY